MDASFLPGMISISSIFGKLIFGYVGGLKNVNRLNHFQFFLLMMSVSLTLLPLAETYTHLLLFSISFGLFDGGFACYIISLTSEIVGLDQLAVGFGMMYSVTSLFSLVGPPLAGNFLIDVFQIMSA